jgi:ferredoxin
VCAASRALRHGDFCGEENEQAGVVIIADPDAAPGIKGEDVLRAYSTKGGTPNVSAMMLRGFAAAAEAMLLLGSGSHRMKGQGVAFSPPGPQLTDELRTGLFICRCGDSLGWSPGLDDYIAALPGRTGAAHCEVLPSACSPEGSASILRTIREKGLTRFVLASCVCCPLDFVCSACTDQRGRLKNTLFHGTGISRAMAETCNLRGEVLTLLKHHPELAEKRFAGLIERSIARVGGLKSLPAPARPYNFTTAIIGDCEAALRSALTLGRAGMEVFLFGTPGRALSSAPDYPNVHAFVGSRATALSGTVGNFRVLVETGGGQQTFHAGAVIVGEQFRHPIPYLPMAGLPSHAVIHTMQERGVRDIPFFNPGATSIPGLFAANPPGINVSERIKGTAAAILAATTMPRGPRQNKGYTVAIDKSRCRGCGRCLSVCPYKAVSFLQNDLGAWCAVVDEALCKGCGDCISVCPSNAADSPYRDRFFLERMIQEILE